MSPELKSTLLFLALAIAVYAVWYLVSGSVFTGLIAAVSILAIGISRAIIRRGKRGKTSE